VVLACDLVEFFGDRFLCFGVDAGDFEVSGPGEGLLGLRVLLMRVDPLQIFQLRIYRLILFWGALVQSFFSIRIYKEVRIQQRLQLHVRGLVLQFLFFYF